MKNTLSCILVRLVYSRLTFPSIYLLAPSCLYCHACPLLLLFHINIAFRLNSNHSGNSPSHLFSSSNTSLPVALGCPMAWTHDSCPPCLPLCPPYLCLRCLLTGSLLPPCQLILPWYGLLQLRKQIQDSSFCSMSIFSASNCPFPTLRTLKPGFCMLKHSSVSGHCPW